MSKKGKVCTVDEINQITCDIDTFVARLFNELQPQYFSNYGLHIRTFVADPGVIVRGTSFCLSESANNIVLNELFINQRESFKALQLHLQQKADSINTVIDILNSLIEDEQKEGS